jgi:hypothetical protein
MHQNAYFFALSAASAAAVVAAPQIAQAICECTLKSIAPSVSKSQGADTFVYNGSPSAGYDAVIVQDSLYGFTCSGAPQVWFDYYLNAVGTATTSATVYRLSYLGTQIGSGLLTQQTYNCTSGACAKEMGPVNVSTTWGIPSSNPPRSVWDIVKVHVSGVSAMDPRTLPVLLASCW